MKTKIFKLFCISLCLCCVFNFSSCSEPLMSARGTAWGNEFMTIYVPEPSKPNTPTGTLTVDGVTYNIELKGANRSVVFINDADFHYNDPRYNYDRDENYNVIDENGNIVDNLMLGFDENGKRIIRGSMLWFATAKVKGDKVYIKIGDDRLYKTFRSKVDYTGKTIVLYRKN